jgi:DNA mismatch endonuclease, patch repair protein
MDTLTPDKRSTLMAKVHSKDTKPELAVRSLLHKMGYRYRLHRKDLPGKPDLTFPSRRAVVFVHGCFWHQHLHCRAGRIPMSKEEYWRPKLLKNVTRDGANLDALQTSGWRVMVVWECETKDPAFLGKRLVSFLDPLKPR